MYRSLFPRDLFAEMDRLRRDMQQAIDLSPGIRGFGSSGFPALNIGTTQESVEIFAFAPGIDPGSFELKLERGVLTLGGERHTLLPAQDAKTAVHLNERFGGRFRRVVNLPDDIDPDSVAASYRDGVLHITVKRQSAARPRRIEIH